MKDKLSQTDFSDQMSPFETEEDVWWQEGKSRIKPEKKFLQTKKAKLIIAAAAVILLLIVMLLLVLLRSQPAQDENLGPETPGPAVEELTPLQQQIKDLRIQLKEADPAKKDTPFPQVDLEINVE